MKKILLNITMFLAAISVIIFLVSLITVINELVTQDFITAWIWMIPLISSILTTVYFFGTAYYLFDENEK